MIEKPETLLVGADVRNAVAIRSDPRSGGTRPPITASAAARYAGVLAVAEVTVTGVLPVGDTAEAIPYFIIDTATDAVVGRVVLPDAVRQYNAVSMIVKIPSAGGPHAIGTFGEAGDFRPSAFLKVGGPAADAGARGSAGPM
ncbi:MAG: hypothetical protein JO107_01660 [Hyphomicrobiales bacterium]|nr:hypothetical protein [Hyphomicrobiales bacterium]MBV8661786.1 hypothetical protein [Hyphomicrobiales bacterium]